MDLLGSSLSGPNRLLELAPEIIQHILEYLKPKDVLSLSQTCSTARQFTLPSNQLLWQTCFIQEFDDPRIAWETWLPTARRNNAKIEEEWDWYTELRKRYIAIRAIVSEDAEKRKENYEENIATLISMVETASRLKVDKRSHESLNMNELMYAFEYSPSTEFFIHDFHTDRESSLLPLLITSTNISRPLTRSMVSNGLSQSASDLASRFHIVHGLTARERQSRSAKGAARSLVYDWFLTGPSADYGPFKQDDPGEVNWKLLEAIYSVITRNFELVTDSRIHFPQGFQYNVAFHHRLADDKDWANIEGGLVGTYSFLDYTDLFHYNVAYRPGFRPQLDDNVEAYGDLMRLDLKLDNSLVTDPRLQTELPFCDDLPKLFFSGVSRSHEELDATALILVRGFAALVKNGKQVRWRFIIAYGGEDQWQLEGVQPGGPQTGGIFGLWSHCGHEANGPIGPFCYYPVKDCPTCPMAGHRHYRP